MLCKQRFVGQGQNDRRIPLAFWFKVHTYLLHGVILLSIWLFSCFALSRMDCEVIHVSYNVIKLPVFFDDLLTKV